MSKVKNIILLLLSWSSTYEPLLAGLDDLPLGARSIGMGSAYVALANTADAVFLNPGGLSQILGTQVSVFYQKPFGLDELSYGMAAVTFPVRSHRFGIGVTSFGNGIYSERMFAFSYSRNHKHQLYWGFALRLQTVQIEEYGVAATAGVDLGMVLAVHSHLSLGFMAKNLNRPAIGTASERLPQTFRLGGALRFSPKITMNLEIFKDVRFAEEARFGVELIPNDRLALRAGTANDPGRFTAGFGVMTSRLSVDYAFSTHNDLGLTHQMSVSMRLGGTPLETTPNLPAALPPELESLEETNRIQTKPSEQVKLNINTAPLEALTSLPGIGPRLARAIVQFREQYGTFESLDDLLKVPGIGARRLAVIRPLIVLGDTKD